MAEEQKDSLSLGANEEIGDYLRRVREARGLNLEHLAKSICLGKNILQAIEDNRWEEFPTEAYLRSYISSMCEKLSVDKMAVIKKFSLDRNSNFNVLQMNLTDEQNADSKSSSIPKVAIIIILAIVAILFLVNKTLNSEPDEEPALEASKKNAVKTAITDSVKNILDSITQSVPASEASSSEPSAAANSQVAKTSDNSRTQDTLRFECTPSATDNTCGVSLKGLDTKMSYFTRLTSRNIGHSDTAQITITVPERTRLLINGTRLDYGKFNTLLFYNGRIIDKRNRELR